MMHQETITVDTYEVVKALLASDFNEQQAEGVVNAIRKINLSHLATKVDIQDLKGEIKDLDHKIDSVEQRLAAKIDSVKADMEIMKRELVVQVWIVGATVAGLMAAFNFLG